ncbi:MAG: cytidylate kinase family protein, partial [Anaerotignum sp.]|nr:cytidylate kinase family protein [Anaerotignum sp.]
IVGRLANHILKDFKNTFHVFIGADMEAKCSRVMKRDGISKEAAEKQILKVEKETIVLILPMSSGAMQSIMI